MRLRCVAVFAALSLAAVVCSVEVAQARYCRVSCEHARRLCYQMAGNVLRGCRYQCRAGFGADTSERAACVADCKAALPGDRAVCTSKGDDCNALCIAASDLTCANEVCSGVYRACWDPVRQATRACLKAAGLDGAAVLACIEPGDSIQNIGRAALDACSDGPMSPLQVCIAGC